jgi:hypothetical protein
MFIRRHLRALGMVLLTATLVGTAPALAGTVVGYARDAGHVDGFTAARAVLCPPTYAGSTGSYPACPRRANRLIATNSRGYLPADIIGVAVDSSRLAGMTSDQFAQTCHTGAVAGYAQVPADVGADWTQVAGYIYAETSSIPFPCSSFPPLARQVSSGVYLVSALGQCTGHTVPAVITVSSSQQLVATYTTVCETLLNGRQEAEDRVVITTLDGAPTNGDFTIMTLQSGQSG